MYFWAKRACYKQVHCDLCKLWVSTHRSEFQTWKSERMYELPCAPIQLHLVPNLVSSVLPPTRSWTPVFFFKANPRYRGSPQNDKHPSCPWFSLCGFGTMWIFLFGFCCLFFLFFLQLCFGTLRLRIEKKEWCMPKTYSQSGCHPAAILCPEGNYQIYSHTALLLSLSQRLGVIFFFPAKYILVSFTYFYPGRK